MAGPGWGAGLLHPLFFGAGLFPFLPWRVAPVGGIFVPNRVPKGPGRASRLPSVVRLVALLTLKVGRPSVPSKSGGWEASLLALGRPALVGPRWPPCSRSPFS